MTTPHTAPSSVVRDALCAVATVVMVLIVPAWMAAVLVALQGAYVVTSSWLVNCQNELIALLKEEADRG